jgi:hypothetical protein
MMAEMRSLIPTSSLPAFCGLLLLKHPPRLPITSRTKLHMYLSLQRLPQLPLTQGLNTALRQPISLSLFFLFRHVFTM